MPTILRRAEGYIGVVDRVLLFRQTVLVIVRCHVDVKALQRFALPIAKVAVKKTLKKGSLSCRCIHVRDVKLLYHVKMCRLVVGYLVQFTEIHITLIEIYSQYLRNTAYDVHNHY